MTASSASSLREMKSHSLYLWLAIATGCAVTPQDGRHAAVPVFRDALAMRGEAEQSEPAQLAQFTDRMLRSVEESMLHLLHSERVAAWDAWARENLRNGDIVFLQSTSNWVGGVIELSRVTQDVTDSPFTHVALAAFEGGDIVLYDIDTPGPGRTRFGLMMADSKTAAVAVKRLRPEFQPFVPKAIDYCRGVHASRLPFDTKLELDNDKLYCAELIEVAFRTSGLELSRPTRWDSLPGLDRHPVAVRTIAWWNAIKPEDYVVVPGNERLGIWSSPGLDLVLPLTHAKDPPRGSRETQTSPREL